MDPNDQISSSDAMSGLIGEVLARRASDTKFRSNVSRGLDEVTEHYAYAWVLPHVKKQRDTRAFLRSAGLAATYKDAAQGNDSVGLSLRRLSLHLSNGAKISPENPDAIAIRLATLAEQNLEGAVMTLRRCLDLAAGSSVAFNFLAIGQMLLAWGDGLSNESLAVRRRAHRDYFAGWAANGQISQKNEKNDLEAGK